MTMIWVKGATATNPKITNKTPLNTLYWALSNLGQSEAKNTSAHETLYKIM